MEIDYTSYGQCRCCLNKGRHRDIMKAYYYQGKREVYYEMFIECFNLYLVTESKASSLICESCINDLRHATAFKSRVSVAEHNILNTLHSLEHGNTVFVNVSETVHSTDKDDEVKPELDIKTEAEDDDGLMAVDIDECDGDDFLLEGAVKDIYLKEDLVPGEAEFLARFKPGSIKLLPTRSSLYDINPAFAKHMDALRGKYITLEMISKLLNTTTSKLSRMSNKKSFVSEKQALAANALAILTNSNVTPFRSKKRKGYPCFYCYTHFEDIRCMREHQLTTHKKTEAKIVLRHMTVETMSVYVDVTDLKCTICDKDIPNINELKSHLTKTHDKKMYMDHPDCVVPFKLGNQFHCQICNGSFQTFGSIERHMNVHFRNHVCHECGGGFLTKHRLKVHIKSMHADGYFPCVLCNKAFTSQQKTNNHVNSVHKSLKRFKCKMCPQRFKEYFRRQRHMVEDHGEAPLSYKCNVCDRSFERRYTLSRHMKRDHLDERDYQCDVCAYTCFTKNELRLHMIKHNGERIHECSVCKKSYARLKTLKEHMRIHNNDRRFSCAVCGQAFVQKCSLKGHIKTHHLEYSIEHNV